LAVAGSGKYAELAAAVRSFKAELIRPNQIERLVESGSVSEVVSTLTHGEATFTEGSDPNAVEAFLMSRLIALTQRLMAYAPPDSRPLIKLFALSHELDCVKEIIRSIADKVHPENALSHIVPAGKFTQEKCKELIEARNPNRVLDFLDDDDIKNFLAPRLTTERSGIAAVSAIDRYYYTRLWNASNLADPLDTQSARGLVGELIDILNILLSFRSQIMGLSARSESDLLIPVNYALGHSLTELGESTNVQNLVRVVERTPYAKALQSSGISEGSVTKIELALKRNHSITCLNAFAGSPFNIGLALALLFLKDYELHDLFAIINGKASHTPVERVLGSLILRGL
jgi:vacuolar-type H+-ATPase subunit C/Vma6